MKYDPEFLENYWMPFTSNRDFKADPRIVERSEGMYMYNDSGDRILDGSSALFCCAAGHSRPEIAEAVHNQLKECAYVPPFQLAQPLAFELARRVSPNSHRMGLIIFSLVARVLKRSTLQ